MNTTCNCEPGVVPSANIYNKAPMPGGNNCNGLKTVIIPKAKGTDYEGQPYAPILGGYRNTIVVYEATGSVYLFDNQGIFTNLTGNQLLPVIEELQKSLDSTNTNVTLLTTRLQSEIAERQSADVDMQNLIQTLQSNLNTEIANRTVATDTLTNSLNALEAKVNAGAGDVAAEATAREEADTNLQAQITANQEAISSETSARENADAQFTTQIADVQTSVTNLAQQVQEAEGKVINLPDSLIQSATLSAGTNEVSVLSSAVNLSTGETSTTTSTIATKTINGNSILGEGDIEISGGGLTPEQSAKLNGLADIETVGDGLTLNANGILSTTLRVLVATGAQMTIPTDEDKSSLIIIPNSDLGGGRIVNVYADLGTQASLSSAPIDQVAVNSIKLGTGPGTGAYTYAISYHNSRGSDATGYPRLYALVLRPSTATT